ncbi:hypothetical protein ONS95_011728 [Cadophora gregata]|uniref:uncharacterized protein n=1 Tax=Cadophora gregata TaxID=51156 RepID=UPI0026DBEFDE|nr:uncharacterized protein ONS95_011728 [Cadophora gregata]KAK0120322.1 hypothetical protein ONS95_011728 [Cadophora gregata]KAK0121355.1 hypothetical protein ONS96_011529 [Cadophora gregata f. sp. sojae]
MMFWDIVKADKQPNGKSAAEKLVQGEDGVDENAEAAAAAAEIIILSARTAAAEQKLSEAASHKIPAEGSRCERSDNREEDRPARESVPRERKKREEGPHRTIVHEQGTRQQSEEDVADEVNSSNRDDMPQGNLEGRSTQSPRQFQSTTKFVPEPKQTQPAAPTGSGPSM